MFNMSVPLWEMGLRAFAVYTFLLLLMRFGGKRQLGQLSPFDFVLMLVVSNAVQNSMNGGDNSLVGGLLSAGVLVLVDMGFTWFVQRHPRIERVLEGTPRVLIHNGRIYDEMLRRENITRLELDAALRDAGTLNVSDVHVALLEVTGKISVLLRVK